MPTPPRVSRTLRQRARAWFAGHDPAAPTTPTDTGGPAPEAVVAWATRDLLRAESSEDVARIVANVIDVLGGRVIAAWEDDGTALPLDVSFGMSEPMLPTAPPNSHAIEVLRRHLPALVADARQAHDTILRTAHLSADVATDPVTGLSTRATFTRELHRLRPDDAVVVMRVTVPAPPPGEDDHLEDAVRQFATYLQAQRGPGDHAARVEEDEFALLLRQTGTAGTTVVVNRLRRAWAGARPDVELHVGVALFHEDGVTTLRDAYDALDDELAADPAEVEDSSDTPAGRPS